MTQSIGATAPTKPCNSCNKNLLSNQQKKCARCFQAIYCSQACQSSDWPQHKKVCKQSVSSKEIMANFRKALRGSQEKWVASQGYRNHLQTKYWPDMAKKAKDPKTNFVLALEDVIHEMFPDTSGRTAIDLGAGGWGNTITLMGEGYSVTAIDSFSGFKKCSTELFSQLPKMNFRGEAVNVNFLEMNLDPQNSVQFPKNGTISVIVATQILPYCSPNDFEAFIQAMHASLVDGGHLIISLNLWQLVTPEHRRQIETNGQWGVQDEKPIINFLELIGFKLIKKQRLDYGYPTADLTLSFKKEKRPFLMNIVKELVSATPTDPTPIHHSFFKHPLFAKRTLQLIRDFV